MKLFHVYAVGLEVMTLAGESKESVQADVLEFVKAFHPRRKWRRENITVVEVNA